MRLSPIIRKLLRPFLSRFFTKTLATATCSLAAAVFSFAFIPAAQAEAEDEESGIQKKFEKLSELGERGKKWKSILDSIEFDFDTTKAITFDEDGFISFSEDSLTYKDGTPKTTTDFYFIWDQDAKKNDSFKFCLTEDKTESDSYKGDVFTIKYQNIFLHSIKITEIDPPKKELTKYGLFHFRNRQTGFSKETPSDVEEPNRDPNDYWRGDVIIAQGGPSRVTWSTRDTKDPWRTDLVTTADGEDSVIHGKDGKTGNKFDYYYEEGSSSNRGIAGGAMYISKYDYSDGDAKNPASSDSISKLKESEAYMHFGKIVGNFINNGLTTTTSTDNPHGGAIYTSLDASIESIKGNFIGNYIKDEYSKSYGGAIYNMGEIGDIEANFIINYIRAKGNYAANAGAICNGKENTEESDVGGTIKSIKGYFIGNYVAHEGDLNGSKDYRKDTLGGAIINYGTIGKLEGVFIGNYNRSNKTANSGVIRNYAQNWNMATIGQKIERDNDSPVDDSISTDTVINGIFIGNYSRGRDGDAFAGVMRNNGDINGTIEGLYVGNYAMTEGTEVTGYEQDESYGKVGAYNYLKYVDRTSEYSKGDSGMAYGGVFYNDIKTESDQASGKPHIGDIKATFVDNYVSSTWGEAFGGAIFNQNAQIYNIASDFQGNYAVTEHFRARGGAIYNDTTAAGINRGYKGELGVIGDVNVSSIINENYAQGKMAQGGAIYVSNNSVILDIYASFSGNYTKSVVADGDSIYYYDIKKNPIDTETAREATIESFTLTPTAQGGALYVADGGITQNISGSFSGNYAQTNGVGYLSKDKMDEDGETIYEGADGKRFWYVEREDGVEPIKGYEDADGNFFTEEEAKDNNVLAVQESINKFETAQGGAIYVSQRIGKELNIQNIEANFIGNYVVNQGDNKTKEGRVLEGVFTTAQGGAIYIYNDGGVRNILGQFSENYASGDSSGMEKETVEGGAIYVSAGGFINYIGADPEGDKPNENEINPVVFCSNEAKASGKGTALTKQEVRGGAIYVSSGEMEVQYEDGPKLETAAGHIEDIYADFIGNKITIDAENTAGALSERNAQGGAVYVSDEARVGDITQGSGIGGWQGFVGNSIEVKGGMNGAAATLIAQGGALYVAQSGYAGNVLANFISNSVTSTSTGNKIERVGGGAIFVQESGFIGSIGSANMSVNISGNKISGAGMGSKLNQQWARGGAIFVSASPKDEKNDGYSIKEIYANIAENSIELDAKDINVLENRIARGGAIYLSESGKMGTISVAGIKDDYGFIGNSITVTGGDSTQQGELIAQGGAFYIDKGATVDGIVANFIQNSISTDDVYENEQLKHDGATGNKSERAGGGAIYVDGNAVIGATDQAGIGSEDQVVQIVGNTITVGGKGANLEEQYARGGAIFVGALEKKDENGDTQILGAGEIKAIYADIKENSITAKLDGSNKNELKDRVARGGAIFLADKGQIGYIHSSDKGGFEKNTITVSGGNADNSSLLSAQGGAMYVARSGGAEGIMAGFSENGIDTNKATGNLSEIVSGGAIYLDEGGNIQAIGEKDNAVVISDNYLKAGGKGQKLETQVVQGGAMYVSGNTTGATNKENAIGEIYADVIENTITAGVDGSAAGLNTRTIQGGAIYLAGHGNIGDIEMDKKGFAKNTITVTGQGAALTTLTVQGGAVFVAEKATIGDIYAHFDDNTITSKGTNNVNSLAQGGAIYVAGGGEIKDIGKTGASVSISNNTVTVGEQAVAGGTDAKNMAQKYAMGGAIYVASEWNAQINEEESGKIDNIYADFTNNSVTSQKGGSDYVEVRVQGGAIFVADSASIGDIKGDFRGNTAISEAQTGTGTKELVHGGAIDVARNGSVTSITGSFYNNGVENSHTTPDENNGSDMHAKGGAIYLAEGGSITTIGSPNSMFQGNYAEGSGQVRAGALFVSSAYVDTVQGTFLRNRAVGNSAELTYGGAMRFDKSTILRLDSNFIQNHTNGYGGGLSLTDAGIIYEVSGDFLGNTARINGGAVEDLGEIGQRGYVQTADGKPLAADYSNATFRYETEVNEEDGTTVTHKYLDTVRDSTDTKEGKLNRQGRGEYDGSFTGGFVNSNFLYNTIDADLTLDRNDGELFRGAGIYTDKDLFITVNAGKEIIMSGNQIKKDGAAVGTRSAIYVDNKNYAPDKDDYQSIVVYLVAQDHGILRIDDNIRGHEDSATGVLLRLRGYTEKVTKPNDYHDKTGLIILNNRVENTYTVMDDVTLYIGYKPRTFNDVEYFAEYGKDDDGNVKTSYDLVKVGDEHLENIVNPDLGESTYLDVAGKTSRGGEVFLRSEDHHQSDIFRDSHMSVRSGTVALTENTYATRSSKSQNRFGDMSTEEAQKEVFTEYLFGSLIAYGADYNYGTYGTLSEDVQKEYLGSALEDATLGAEELGDDKSLSDKTYHRDNGKGLYATFEFGMSYDSKEVYDLAPAGKFYYMDMNGNYTEKSSWTSESGEVHDYTKTDVPVNRKMAKSDVLTVFAQWDDAAGTVEWTKASKGRVTLNGITVKAAMDGWQYTKKAVAGDQQWGDESPTTDETGNVLTADHYNRDLYVQLINYMLVDGDRTPIKDAEKLEKFHALFDESKDEADPDTNSGYHLLRLSGHFDLVHDATAYMKGSDVLADEIELATTVTKDDSVHIVNWRDHLAEWAEHEGSLTGDAYAEVMGNKTESQDPALDSAGLYDGRKHFLLDQSVYYLNRNINLLPNPENGDDTTGKEMWGKYLTVEGAAMWRTLDLQQKNMLSLIIADQQVRLQSFTLKSVQDDLMQNEGDLIFDTMRMEPSLVVNNAGNGLDTEKGHTLNNQLTVTGIMDIDFTITTRAGYTSDKPYTALLGNGEKISWQETLQHGEMFINHTTETTKEAAKTADEPSPQAAAEDAKLSASVIRILGTVEHQDITHGLNPNDGTVEKDGLSLNSDGVEYKNPEGGVQKLPTWSIGTGNKGADDVRESFYTNTYLNTTSDGVTATEQFKAFVDNSLTMDGGAFNLGSMWKHRLQLRSFSVNGGAVFVDHSTIDLTNEVMGGIDACLGNVDHSSYAGGDKIIAHDKSTDAGLIWLQGFTIEGSSEKQIVHVKFVDDGVGNAVKDGMGIANGAAESGMRIMPDGDGVYNWEVTYNDPEAVNANKEYTDNVLESTNRENVRGMYTFRRRGFTEEAQISSVTQVTGSLMTMMQVYNYAFQHADMFADSVYDAQREQLYERNYTVITPVKGGKNAVPNAAPRPCTDKASLRSGLWFNTFASAEQLPLHNGPEVRMDMYGGFVGGDSSLTQHRSGWSSVWSLYGGYVGSTQRYDGVRVRQNGASIGGTGTFYKKNFYTALTASVGTSRADATGRGGSEDFNLYMGGIASRSGYNFTLDGGRYVVQPSLLLSFSLFDASDYTNAYGSKVDTRLSGVFQVNPSVKIIRRTDCVWKPYASVGFVYNLFSDTKYKINGTELPSMSIDPYVEYSLGVQRNLGESYTIFGQATGRNGGRNGGELNVGLRYNW